MSRAVLSLYHNQGKTIRDIAKAVRMSFRDIGAILKKADEAQERKEQQDNDDNVSDKKTANNKNSSYL
jgi:Mor family transcriptional regulator